jgi:aryl-alcohol dehydrogenase-like predicted oxidoreductase
MPRMKFLVERVTDKARNEVVGRLSGIAAELGCTLPQLAIAWCAANPRVSTVITGASRVAQVKENMGAAGVVARLTPEVMARIDALAGAAAD